MSPRHVVNAALNVMFTKCRSSMGQFRLQGASRHGMLSRLRPLYVHSPRFLIFMLNPGKGDERVREASSSYVRCSGLTICSIRASSSGGRGGGGGGEDGEGGSHCSLLILSGKAAIICSAKVKTLASSSPTNKQSVA